MKRKILLFLFGCLLLTGCGIESEKTILKKATDNVTKANSYYIEGTMELINNEDIYTYSVKASYKKEDFYKVELVNVSNNHEQIILRNKEGVYVITPSLNKSFKFQSDWPYNNSQVYLLSSVIDDLNNDENKTFSEKDGKYLFTSSVNYPNNNNLKKQIVTINKDHNIEKVEIINDENKNQITMKFDKIDLKPTFDDNYFDLDEIIDVKTKNDDVNNSKEETESKKARNRFNEIKTRNNKEQSEQSQTEQTVTLDDVIYPMYLPINTYLTNQESVDTDNGKRLILTFSGDNSFTLIEEMAVTSKTHEIIPTFGDIELFADAIAVVNSNSINWISNGIEYYVVSNTLGSNELLEIAKSISVIPVAKLK